MVAESLIAMLNYALESDPPWKFRDDDDDVLSAIYRQPNSLHNKRALKTSE